MSIFVKGKLLIGAFLLPRTLRSRMICLAVFMVFLPILVISYLVEEQGKEALLNEKTNKLLSITHLLDRSLGDDFSRYPQLFRQERIMALNNLLAERTEVITRDFPNVGAGFYNKELDSIITYAPKGLYGNKVGVSIDDSHPGRIAMVTGATQIKLGSQVRGNILNVMLPIQRNGEIIGYIWANESSNDINKQTWAMDASIISVSVAGLMISLLLIVSFSRRLSRDVDMIKHRLSKLPFDLNTKLPPLAGEMEGIADKINHLSYALKEAKTLNELIIESAADGMISIDVHGRITMCNPAASAITGFSFNELFNNNYADIFEKEDYHSPLLDTLKRGVEHIGVEVSYPAKDHILQIKASSSQLRNADEEIIGALVIFTDLTEQKEMQRHMAQAERLATLGELMASVAHEVRNPLTAISGFVQYLKESEQDQQRIEYIDIILHEVRSINNVIQQLLNLSHVHSQIFHKSSINKIIRDSLILIQTNGLTSRVDFNIHLDERIPDIDVDASSLKQVFLNLLINAVQAITARGEITVSTIQSAIDKVEINIEDTGVGMNEEIQKKIFMPFFTTKTLGTGLGLSIVQRIINEHRGDIVIKSRMNYGTKVIITLPMIRNNHDEL
ncbi:two-component system sensor histidine kinase AtoS [Obesumbacterium proteus]|nr:two-component system sensor histidine kinase AtoS [Obesumbacterium proteus]